MEKTLKLRNIFGREVRLKKESGGLVIHVDETPANPKEGIIYHDTVTDKYFNYYNGKFVPLDLGIKIVDEDPETGEPGKIYFNIVNNEYLTANSEGDVEPLTTTASSNMPIKTIDATGLESITLKQGMYHIIENLPDEGISFILAGIDYSHKKACSYVGRFTAPDDDYTIDLVPGGNPASTTPVTPVTPGDTPGGGTAKAPLRDGTPSEDNSFDPNEDISLTVFNIYFDEQNPDIEANHVYEFNILYDSCSIRDITPAI